MSTNPLRREGGYWKPVLDYDYWDEAKPAANGSEVAGTDATVTEPLVRHDLCHRCGSEFVVDSPYCRMCGRAREGEIRPVKSRLQLLDFYQLRRRLGLSLSAMVCLVVGLVCIGAAVATGFIYTAGTLVDWQAVQIWRGEWLIAAGAWSFFAASC